MERHLIYASVHGLGVSQSIEGIYSDIRVSVIYPVGDGGGCPYRYSMTKLRYWCGKTTGGALSAVAYGVRNYNSIILEIYWVTLAVYLLKVNLPKIYEQLQSPTLISKYVMASSLG